MYQPKPINPSLLRLNAAAKLVLESINAGDIISASGREEQASDAANALQTAHELAFAEMHHQASPYLLFRKEIMASTHDGALLRDLTLHFFKSGDLIDLVWLFESADRHHVAIAIQLIESFARNGTKDPHFTELASEIRDLAITKEIAA